MSAISSTGSSAQLQYLQQLMQGQKSQSPPPDFKAELEARLEGAAKAVGVDPAKIPDLIKQIQDAAQNATKNAGETGDPRAAAKDAVDGVLKKNGVDPAKFRSAIEAQGGKTHGHHHGHRQGVAQAAGASPQPDLSPKPGTINQDGSIVGTRLDFAA